MISEHTNITFYESFVTDPSENMALLDQLNSFTGKHQNCAFVVCMSYSPDTLIVGRSQNTKDFDIRKAREDGVRVVRRLTGGTGVFTTEDDFLYHIVIGRKCFTHDIKKYIRVLCQINDIFVGVLEKLGTKTSQASFIPHSAVRHCDCFATSDKCELLTKGRKIHGSAYKFNGSVYWQEGAIPIVSEYGRIQDYYRKEQSSRHTLPISVQEVLGDDVTNRSVFSAVVSEFSERFNVTIDTIPDRMLRLSKDLAHKYEVV